MTSPAQAVRPAPPKQLRIGLWGPPGSGKTTFLAALYIAIQRREGQGNWIMSGADENAHRFLLESMHHLTTSKTFPTMTFDATGMVFHFVGERVVMRRNKWGVKMPEIEKIAFDLEVLDVPGSMYGYSADRQPDRQDGGEDEDGFQVRALRTPSPSPENITDHDDRLLDHLQMCQGIIYLFDPQRDARAGDAFQFFYPVIQRLAGRIIGQYNFAGTRLPQHVAVCVTKFDQPDVYRKAYVRGFTIQDGEPPFLPRVDNDRAADFFQLLCEDPNTYTDLVAKGLRSHFHTLGYFVTSSIGFYVADQRFRPHDCMNVVRTGPGTTDFRIKGKVYPINVFEPLLWLQQSLYPAG